jgi:hypothetical protein
MNKYKNKIVDFLNKNGWEMTLLEDEYETYEKENNISIAISEDEIVLIGEEGDFAHIILNEMTFYYLIGFLFHYRYISINYKV